MMLSMVCVSFFFFFSSRRRHTRWNCDWSSDVCSSDLGTSALGTSGSGAGGSATGSSSLGGPAHDREATPGGAPNPTFDRVRDVGEHRRRSEERRVGKECRSGWSAYHEKKKKRVGEHER